MVSVSVRFSCHDKSRFIACFRFALVASSIGVLSTISHGNERFVSGFEDLPLMRGMTEATESNVAFDTVHGRVLVSLHSPVKERKDTSILQRGIEPTRLEV